MTADVEKAATDDGSINPLKNLLLNQQWQAIANHVRTNPTDAKHSLEFNGIKALPLHVACAIGAPIGVIKCIISAYSAAAQIKNDSGRLPLHCLFLHRCPTLNVLSAIIEAYPAASHIADGTGKLPIHYACEQQNVTDDFFTILLSTYPEGAYARDGMGNFPINYATSNADLITRKCALAALDRGTLFASISKMTSIRILDDQKVKIDALEDDYMKKISKMKKDAKEERGKFKSEIEGLKSQLKELTYANLALTQELEVSNAKQDDAVNAAIKKEQATAAELEKNLRMELADVQLKNMDLVDQLESVQLNLEKSKASNDNKESEIEELKEELNRARKQIASLEHANASKCNYIANLEDSLGKAQKAAMTLSTKQKELQNAMDSQKSLLDSLASDIDGAFAKDD